MSDIVARKSRGEVYVVRMYYDKDTGDFVAKVAPGSGIVGMVAFTAYPAIITWVEANNPAHAISQAWDAAEKSHLSDAKLADSEEDFLRHVLATAMKEKQGR